MQRVDFSIHLHLERETSEGKLSVLLLYTSHYELNHLGGN